MYCSMSYWLIECVVRGRFGDNCDKKCHCKNVTEDCQMTDGQCKTGCAQHFTGDNCQGNVLCALTAWCVYNNPHLV